MTGQDIYNGALSMIAEVEDSDGTEDYQERAPYLLGAFIMENAELDNALRHVLGLMGQRCYSASFLELTDDFPFCQRFVYGAECYLASMLILDEDPELADRLYERYQHSMDAIRQELPEESGVYPFESGEIRDCYLI